MAVNGLMNGVTALTAGDFHTCAVMTTGGVKCWGLNSSGQLGDGTNEDRHTPVDVSELQNGIKAVAGGGSHTCALTTTGGVKCWGGNWAGQLGDSTTNFSSIPVDTIGMTSGVRVLTANWAHTCALTSSGGVKCWGLNDVGQLGDGSHTDPYIPIDVNGITQGASDLAAGGRHTCAVLSTGGSKCWGANWFGQLGNGTVTFRSVPLDVSGTSSTLTEIAVGGGHTCALTTMGGVRCWGHNWSGQLGDGTTIWRSNPVDVKELASGVVTLATGGNHSCALMATSGVKCWGANERGQLGDGTTADRSIPVDVDNLTDRVTALTTGYDHTCALTINGGVKCWGDNSSGQLGNGTNESSGVPVDVLGLVNGVRSLVSGAYHTCALITSGGVKCWGANWFGQLGVDEIFDSNTPVDVSGLSNGITRLTAGAYHTCALTVNGGVKCWGDNLSGQLGNGTNDSQTFPVDVNELTNGVMGLEAGNFHTCALMANGGLKCWGANQTGQLGDGTASNRSIPVDVSGFTGGVAAVAGGGSHTCALTTSGHAKCWGFDGYGQIGLGTITHRLTPVDVTLTAQPELRINYPSGRVGSFFTLTGANFPANMNATVRINGQVLNSTIPVNETGQFIFFLSTSGASTGDYQVTVSVNPAASVVFSVLHNAPLRVQEGGGQTLAVPGSAGTALPKVYLPALINVYGGIGDVVHQSKRPHAPSAWPGILRLEPSLQPYQDDSRRFPPFSPSHTQLRLFGSASPGR